MPFASLESEKPMPTTSATKPRAPLPVSTKQSVVDMSKTLLNTSYAQSLQSVNVGFSMASALAWNEVVREYILKNLSVKKSQYYHLIYATIVTFLSALVFMITKMFLDKNIKESSVVPVVAFR